MTREKKNISRELPSEVTHLWACDRTIFRIGIPTGKGNKQMKKKQQQKKKKKKKKKSANSLPNIAVVSAAID